MASYSTRFSTAEDVQSGKDRVPTAFFSKHFVRAEYVQSGKDRNASSGPGGLSKMEDRIGLGGFRITFGNNNGIVGQLSEQKIRTYHTGFRGKWKKRNQ